MDAEVTFSSPSRKKKNFKNGFSFSWYLSNRNMLYPSFSLHRFSHRVIFPLAHLYQDLEERQNLFTQPIHYFDPSYIFYLTIQHIKGKTTLSHRMVRRTSKKLTESVELFGMNFFEVYVTLV